MNTRICSWLFSRLRRSGACAVIAALPALASAQPYAPLPLLNVSGSADVKVVPDEIVLNVGVETRHADLAVAKSENDERVASALKFIRSSGVAERDVQTDFISVEPSYDHNLQLIPKHYVVRKSIEFKLRDPARFEAVLTGALNNGVNHVLGVNFRTSELRKHRDAARQMAIRAAREKADALAAELGVKRGKLHTLSENTWGGWFGWSGSGWGPRGGGFMAQNAMSNAGGSTTETGEALALGQISVSATVSVSFLIE